MDLKSAALARMSVVAAEQPAHIYRNSPSVATTFPLSTSRCVIDLRYTIPKLSANCRSARSIALRSNYFRLPLAPRQLRLFSILRRSHSSNKCPQLFSPRFSLRRSFVHVSQMGTTRTSTAEHRFALMRAS
jgi:hypothetical protein